MLNLLKKKQISFNKINRDIIISESNNISKPDYKPAFSSPSWKEWSNSIYSYNKQYVKLLVHKDKLVNYLFKSYFNLTKRVLELKRKRFNPKRLSSNKLFLSEAEIKHTNNSVNITLFLFNKNKNFMKYKLSNLRKNLYKLYKSKKIWNRKKRTLVNIYVFNIKTFKSNIYRQMKVFFNNLRNNLLIRMNILFNISKDINVNNYTINNIFKKLKINVIEEEKRENFWRNILIYYIKKNRKLKKNYLKLMIRYSKKYNDLITNNKINQLLYRVYMSLFLNNHNMHRFNLNTLYDIKYKVLNNKFFNPYTLLNKRNFKIYKFLYYYQMLIFNKNKFTNWFLNYRSFGIINIISKIYKKKVEFNIVNLKSMHLNSNIYSEAIALKLKNRKLKLLRILKKALFKIKIPRLFDLYNIDKKNLGNIKGKKDVLNSIKYKLISGVRFEASGRLTRRLIASRSIFKFRYVGSLKNIYSSYVGLSPVMLRGYLKSNIQYTIINSKTRNGAFGLKGWTSSY